jgi:hypothetical protein
LHKGDTYSQHWTGLGPNSPDGSHDGWSMKLRPASSTSATCMQYEYTYQPYNPQTPDTIWFDISYVDGDPFKQNWALSSNNATCHASLHHEAYEYSTDDARGMQSPCDCTADITLVLCPAGSSSSSTPASTSTSSQDPGLIGGLYAGATSVVGGIVSDVFAPLTAAAAPSATSTYAAPAAPTTTAAPAATAASSPSQQQAPQPTSAYSVARHDSASAPSPTTLITSYAPKTYGTTVVEVETAWVTEIVTVNVPTVTEYATRRRARHMHHAAHNA